jgi:Ca2+-binding EF-hand superfamily protein
VILKPPGLSARHSTLKAPFRAFIPKSKPMKKSSHVIVAALVTALACPIAVQAAKADRKNKNQQQEQLPVAFAAADTNGDGNVTKEEFVAALKEKLGEGGASSKFASLDKNSDGKLSKEEYSGGATEPKKRRKKDK